MTAHDPNLQREARGILTWLGLGAKAAPGHVPEQPQSDDAAMDPRDRRRRDLLSDVSSFLMTHRLEVDPYTLAIAHDVITGADQRLARQIELRVASREPVTREWLDAVGRTGSQNDGTTMLNELMAKLESSLTEFTTTTMAARSATSEYQTALEAHVGELEQVSKAGVVISELATIARIMLERTREIEQEMSRSEMQTRSLQVSLDEARRRADHDHLTGLPNRRAFETVLAKEVEIARTAGEPLCVAFCDIDHFKRINDTHGHDAGDRVLKVVAKTLASISGDKCHVARHGGEEFVIAFRSLTPEECLAALDVARETMARRQLVNRATDVPFGNVTFSGGIADVFAYPTPSDALKAADEALYAAKAAGRNRILLAGPTSAAHPAAEDG